MRKIKFITQGDLILPERNPESHKGDNGKVLAVGGSEQYAGAIVLAGLAALRSGADLVNIIAPEKVAWAINCCSPDLITTKIKERFFSVKNCSMIRKLMEKYDVLLIGNGIGLNKKTAAFCRKIIKNTEKPKVIDADAIKSISMNDCVNSIITPHNKELEQFLRNSNIDKGIIKKIFFSEIFFPKSKLIKKTTQKFLEKNNIILLKGKIDCIITKNKIYYNKTGNVGMTKGGTGDVLAGMCAGFLAQSKDLVQSAINAAYINGLIGDILLRKKKGFTYLASDMVEEMKRINSELWNPSYYIGSPKNVWSTINYIRKQKY